MHHCKPCTAKRCIGGPLTYVIAAWHPSAAARGLGLSPSAYYTATRQKLSNFLSSTLSLCRVIMDQAPLVQVEPASQCCMPPPPPSLPAALIPPYSAFSNCATTSKSQLAFTLRRSCAHKRKPDGGGAQRHTLPLLSARSLHARRQLSVLAQPCQRRVAGPLAAAAAAAAACVPAQRAFSH